MSDKKSKLENRVLEAYQVKDIYARTQLAHSFAVFIKNANARDGYVIFGGPVRGETFANNNFVVFFGGAMATQIREAKGILHATDSYFASEYHEKDFHSTAATRVLSRYAKAILENRKKPVPFMVEFLFVDCANTVTVVNYDGDSRRLQLDEKKGSLALVGAYDPQFRSLLHGMFAKLANEPLSEKKIKQFSNKLQKTFNLPSIAHARIAGQNE